MGRPCAARAVVSVIAGTRPSERRMLRTNPLGSWLLGPGDEGSRRLRVRVQILLTASVVLANIIGILLVVLLMTVVIPGGEMLRADLVLVNFVAVPLYAGASLVVGSIWGTVWALKSLRWSIEDRDADRKDRIATLRVPWKLTIVSGVLWLVGTAAFTLMYGLTDAELILKVAFTTGMAGIVVCANTYLLSEFALRPVAARALSTAPPRHAVGFGITLRSLLIWLLSAIPVAGLMIVAISALVRENVTTNRLAITILALGGIGLVFGLLLIWMNTRAMVAPIRTVTAGLAKVQRGDLYAEVLVFDGTELGLLQTGFNQMVSDVRERERIRDLFGRHVGEDVAEAAMSRQIELGGEVRDVAVLFIDVVGSTAIATEQPPQDVVKLLNRFFAVVVAEVHEHGGFVNKFEGDAVLAIFGAPEDLDDAAGKALAAARTMTARLRDEVPECEAGVGVSAGQAVAGNVGAESRFEYTVIGDPVNEAARLSEQAKGVDGRVVASMRAVEAASSDEAERWHEVDEVQLRGRIEATRIAVPAIRVQ
ncbi:adenylate/guanylate cyclase domain-containing protein [Aeromicrobium sp.]|uniref:adenylate/guanylate cyclase domain-containing protein n=1 Tax=Aeromicrobium sp. TaxID=1871063 RepID=UPI003D6B2934